MSRTVRGSKGPGWEPWSHRDERQKPAPDPDADRYTEAELSFHEEGDLALYCYLFGPCEICKANKKQEEE